MKKTWKIKLAVPIIAFCLTAVQPIPAYAAKEDITAVITAIDSLPSSEDLNDSYAPQVEDIWKAYQELTMAEKINVSNYDKLEKEYKMLLDSGAIVDNEAAAEEEQSKIDRERNSVAVSGKTEAQTTDYTFQISSWEKLTYRVESIDVVEPYDADAIRIQPGKDMVTLLTWLTSYEEVFNSWCKCYGVSRCSGGNNRRSNSGIRKSDNR